MAGERWQRTHFGTGFLVLESGELSLSVVSQAQIFFRQEERYLNPIDMDAKKEILGRLSGKSSRETERELFEKAKGLFAHSNPNMSWAELFQKVTEIALQKVDPQRSVSPTRKLQDRRRRAPNVGLRREIWKRDGGKCRKCGSQYALEVGTSPASEAPLTPRS
jgi:hypothetical protein